MKNKKIENIIVNIVRIKINLFFMIIFAGGMKYSAEKLGNAITISELFFWTSILLIIAFQIFNPMRKIFDMIEEWNVNRIETSEKRRKTQ